MKEIKQTYVGVDKKDKLYYYNGEKYIPVLDETGGGGGDIELKTINGESLKGSGNIEVLTEHQPLKTINGEEVAGEGNIEIQGGEGLDASKYIALEWVTNNFGLYGYKNHPVTSISELLEIISSWPEEKSIFIQIREGSREIVEVATVSATTGDRGQLFFDIYSSQGYIEVTIGTAVEEWTAVNWALYKPNSESCSFQDKDLELQYDQLILPTWYCNICNLVGFFEKPLQVIWIYDDLTTTNGWLVCNDSQMILSFDDGSRYEGEITVGEAEGEVERKFILTELSMTRPTAEFNLDNFLTPEEINAFAAAWTSNTNTSLAINHPIDTEDSKFLKAANKIKLSVAGGQMAVFVYKIAPFGGYNGISPATSITGGSSKVTLHNVSLIVGDELILAMVVQVFSNGEE